MDPILVAALGIAFMFVLIGLHIPIRVSMALGGLVGFGLGWWPHADICFQAYTIPTFRLKPIWSVSFD